MHVYVLKNAVAIASCIVIISIIIMLLYSYIPPEPSDFCSHCTSPIVASLIPAYAIKWKKSCSLA